MNYSSNIEPWKEVYKVLCKDGSTDYWRGPVVGVGEASVQYILGHILKPNPNLAKRGYLLTAFKSYSDAMLFLEDIGSTELVANNRFLDIQIWFCFAHGLTYDLPPKLSLLMLSNLAKIPRTEGEKMHLIDDNGNDVCVRDLTDIKSDCNCGLCSRFKNTINPWPQGTVMVKELKMIQKTYSVKDGGCVVDESHNNTPSHRS
jgi:hypothetical protein